MLAAAVTDVGVVVSVIVHGPVTAPQLLEGVAVDRAAVEAYESGADVLPFDALLSPRYDAAAAAAGMVATSNSTLLQLSHTQETETQNPRLFFECTPTDARVRQHVVHYLNLLPFGLRRPSAVFSVVGRHTNHGLVLGVTDDGKYRVLPYSRQQQQPLQLEAVRTAPQLSYQSDIPPSAVVDPLCLQHIHRESRGHAAQQRIAQFFRRARGRGGGAEQRRTSFVSLGDTATAVSNSTLGGSMSLLTTRPLPSTATAGSAGGSAGATGSGAAAAAGGAVMMGGGAPSVRAPRRLPRLPQNRSGHEPPSTAASASSTVSLHAPPMLSALDATASFKKNCGVGSAYTPRTTMPSFAGRVVTISTIHPNGAAGAAVGADSSVGAAGDGSPLVAGGGMGTAAAAAAAAATPVATYQSTLSEESQEVLYALRDLQLPPPLALHSPLPPLRVGTRVIARRFGCAGVLHTGLVISAAYDVTYTIRYDSDGEVDTGVLHNDVHALDSVEDDGNTGRRHQQPRDRSTEPCRVRDHVVFEVAQRTHRGVVMASLGFGRYHVAIVNAPVPLIEVEARQILSVTPVLFGAVFAQPRYLALFRQLDSTGSGRVSWKDVRHYVLSSEMFGQPLSFQRLGELQRDMRICRRGVEPQLLSKVPVQEEEQQLSFRDFEYVLMRVENLL